MLRMASSMAAASAAESGSGGPAASTAAMAWRRALRAACRASIASKYDVPFLRCGRGLRWRGCGCCTGGAWLRTACTAVCNSSIGALAERRAEPRCARLRASAGVLAASAAGDKPASVSAHSPGGLGIAAGAVYLKTSSAATAASKAADCGGNCVGANLNTSRASTAASNALSAAACPAPPRPRRSSTVSRRCGRRAPRLPQTGLQHSRRAWPGRSQSGPSC